jgi:serine/threonine-protein kinase
VVDKPAIATAGEWTCPTCHGTYPADFAVCPRDATPRADKIAKEDPLIGEVLGRTYKLVRVLGEGGMARLYEAEHLRIDTHYAVKVIHDDLARDKALLARFEREAKAAARISSEHVVRLVDVLRTNDGRPCLVEELLHGEDLQVKLDRVGKLKVAEAIPIARQVCRAVADAHAAGVVHRDLKPSNVFLCKQEGDDEPFVKVFDFGVAKVEGDDQLTRTDAVMGTAAYMAPEQARRAADAGPLADGVDVGAIVYHMLTGEPPYGRVPAVSRFALVLHEEPTRPREIEPSIPDGVEAVIQQAMARERPARLQSALDLEHQLASFDTPTAATQTTKKSAPVATQEATALQLARKNRVARPLAIVIAMLSSVAAGAWIAALLAAFAHPTSSSESALIVMFAVGAVAGIGFLHASVLRKRWRSAPAVTRHTKPAARALLGAAVTLGALQLFAYGAAVVFHADPLGEGGRLVLTGIAAVLGLGWERFSLDERVRRRLG